MLLHFFNKLSFFLLFLKLPIYFMCNVALYWVKLFISWVKSSYVFLSSSFQAYVMFIISLAYLYIQYTETIWPASFYDAHTWNQNQHPVPRWYSWPLRVCWWASLLFRGLLFTLFSSILVSRMIGGFSWYPF